MGGIHRHAPVLGLGLLLLQCAVGAPIAVCVVWLKPIVRWSWLC